jgi:O-Antigen ligase
MLSSSTSLTTTLERRRALFVLPAAALAAAICGLLAGVQPVLLAIPVLLVIPVILWRRPEFAIITLLASATLIENFTYTVGTHAGAFTSKIPWWRTFTHGMIIFPVEFFLLIVIMVWVLKAGVEGGFGIPKSPVFRCLKVFWALLLVAVGVGMAHGAKIKFDFWELRSWIYLSVAMVLAAALIRKRSALDLVLWTFVLGSGFKGLQGTYIFFSYARAMRPRPEAILGHEEAFFFGVFIMITAAYWLYGFRGRLRTTATCLLPFVVVADMANARRTAWLILAVGLLTMAAIGVVTLPHRRKVLLRALAVLVVVSTVYLPAYWNHDGTLAQPARAVRSQFQPNSRDASSDLYREQENFTLITNIKSSSLLGTGFGIPIQYNSQIANISNIDPMIAFIPHNGLLWVWLRTGLQGEIVFWCLISLALIRACELARCPDRRLAMIGTIVACAIVGYAIDGYEDMGFAEFRIAAAMGCLIGVVEATIRIAQASARDDQLLLIQPQMALQRRP